MKNAHHSWFFIPEPKFSPRLRLFCFPFAGGAASAYLPWRKAMPADVELVGIQLPGRENPPLRRLSEIVNVLSNLIPEFNTLPYLFFGHSMGALISYEVTAKFQSETLPLPQQLIVSACKAPYLSVTHTPRPKLTEENIIARLKEYNGTPPQILEDKELLKIFMPRLEADIEMLDTYLYEPKPALKCPISAFAGADDLVVNISQIKAWKEHTTHPLEMSVFSGGHFFINDSQTEVLENLQSILEKSIENIKET